MTLPKNLFESTKEEFQNFMNSFDYVISDIDGTLVHGQEIIAGADKFLLKLRKLGKTIAYVTNNSLESTEDISNRLKQFDIKSEDILNPNVCVVKYLKTTISDKGVFVVGSNALKKEIKKNGLCIVDFENQNLETSQNPYEDLLNSAEKIKSNINKIGAVVLDLDMSVSWQKLEAVVIILNLVKDIPLIFGATDFYAPLSEDLVLLGPKIYQEYIAKLTNRTPIIFGKPSVNMKTILEDKLKFDHPRRVLMIGDSIATDMGLAANCGFQKLLVGLTIVDKWSHPEEYKPDYYVVDLGVLNSKFNKFFER